MLCLWGREAKTCYACICMHRHISVYAMPMGARGIGIYRNACICSACICMHKHISVYAMPMGARDRGIAYTRTHTRAHTEICRCTQTCRNLEMYSQNRILERGKGDR
jgi:hypothetical protein